MTLYADRQSRLTISDLLGMKQSGEKITCLTAYDASFTALLEQCNIEVILIGDSLGMVIQGHDNTLPVSVDEISYHCRCVSKARQRALLIGDLPFASYASAEQAIHNAAHLIQEGGVDMVKLEGNKTELIAHLTANGIPVCGHLGLLPQSVNLLGGYKVQGRSPEQAEQLLQDARDITNAGASLLVLECVPAELAGKISRAINIPVIGIGAGVDCDGQVLVLYDMLNISIGNRPRFSKNFMQDSNSIEAAIRAYHSAVKHATFPGTEHSY